MNGWRGAQAGATALLAAALLLLSAAPAWGLPAGFFGVVPQTPLTDRDWERMEGAVETVRFTFDWGRVEPAPGRWEFAALDAAVAAATKHGIRVMPLLYGVPPWIDPDPASAPSGARERAAWVGFVRRLVARYGPGGDFWRGYPRPAPIRRWQVWNEPNIRIFWRPRPEPARYAGLLRDSARAIRSLDPGATVVAAGVAPVQGGMSPAVFLRRMYSVPGARRFFDLAALHPYSFRLDQLRYQLHEIRAVMAAGGDRAKPLLISEIGVASGADRPTPFDRGLHGQARFVRQGLGLLVAERGRWRIAGVDWFSWRDGPVEDPYCAFCQQSGLIDSSHRAKPAWQAYRRLARLAKLPPAGAVR